MALRSKWQTLMSKQRGQKSAWSSTSTPSRRDNSQATATQGLAPGPELALDACLPAGASLLAGTHSPGGGERHAWEAPKKRSAAARSRSSKDSLAPTHSLGGGERHAWEAPKKRGAAARSRSSKDSLATPSGQRGLASRSSKESLATPSGQRGVAPRSFLPGWLAGRGPRERRVGCAKLRSRSEHPEAVDARALESAFLPGAHGSSGCEDAWLDLEVRHAWKAPEEHQALDARVPGSTLLPGKHGPSGCEDAWLDLEVLHAWKAPEEHQALDARVPGSTLLLVGALSPGSGEDAWLDLEVRHAWKEPEDHSAEADAALAERVQDFGGSDSEGAEEDEEEESKETDRLAWQEKVDSLASPGDTERSSSEDSLIPFSGQPGSASRSFVPGWLAGRVRRERPVGLANFRGRSEGAQADRASTRMCCVLPAAAASSSDLWESSASSSSSALSGSGTRPPPSPWMAW